MYIVHYLYNYTIDQDTAKGKQSYRYIYIQNRGTECRKKQRKEKIDKKRQKGRYIDKLEIDRCKRIEKK